MSVVWNQVSLDRLADIYVRLTLDAQRELAAFVDRVNATLASAPQFLGESRGDSGRRIWFTGPLAITYRLVPGGGVLVVYVSPLKHGAAEDDE